MSLLLIEIPPRQRLAARSEGGGDSALRVPGEWFYVWSSDARQATRSGVAATALLPKADSVIAVLAETDVSWHAVTPPRAAASRMRVALQGQLEEALLDDTEAVHFALAPKASGGTSWVAAMHQGWVSAVLDEIERSGMTVERLAPAAAPLPASWSAPLSALLSAPHASEPRGEGHFRRASGDDQAPVLLTVASTQGVWQMPLAGSMPRALIAPGMNMSWSATPAAAAAAEHWLGAPVAVQGDAERLLRAAASPWNLRQFDLAPRHRGTLALRDGWRRFLTRDWRAVRWGLAALVALHLVGLNAWAWSQSRLLKTKTEAMAELLRATHPQVRTVLDAPLQMQRETEALRARAGRAGDGDIEVLLAAAATAWPDGAAPLQGLRFESGRLILVAPAFAPAQLAPLRERLLAAGFDAELSEGRVTVSRAAAKPTSGRPA